MNEKTYAYLRKDAFVSEGRSAFSYVDPDYREKTKRIVFDSRPASDVPVNAVRIDEDYATPDASHRIYGWLTDDGTMHVWTNANAIRLTDEDAGCLYSRMKETEEIDLSRIDTSEVTDMSGMFDGCQGLTSLDFSSFDTSKVTTMYAMFYDCPRLTSLDLSSFDTSQVTNMSWMFYNCSELKSLDVSSFDTSKVTNMCDMFTGSASLMSLDLSSFEVSDETDIGNAFSWCSGQKVAVGDRWKRTDDVPGVSIIQKEPAKRRRMARDERER